MKALACLLALAAGAAQAEGLVAARTLPAGSVLTTADLILSDKAQGVSRPSDAVGQQTRVTIYEGRPILAAQLQAPRLVSRNQLVRLGFQRGPLRIEVEGRALGEGGAGDVIRVMNVVSRSTVTARIDPDGGLTVTN